MRPNGRYALAAALATLTMVAAAEADTTEIEVFAKNVIHFTPDDPAAFDSETVLSESDGRVAVRTVSLPAFEERVRITATVTTIPIPKDETSVHDPWDRAGNVRLAAEGEADIELVKFVTAYGGVTEHEVDLSHLAPLLTGVCTFKGFVDTWVSPGWKIDFVLRFEPIEEGVPLSATLVKRHPTWCEGVIYEESVTAESTVDDPTEAVVSVPEGTERVLLYYLSSGHCTDGTDADEFVSKDNVISVDGVVVHRFRPWRSDCRRFRDINPYTRRWSDGWWSSDYSRSGWCPGDVVEPLVLDLSDHLTPGAHTICLSVEDVRPRDDDGHFGYWRVSAHLVGWEARP